MVSAAETIVLSLGGSLINPGKIDTPFLKKLKALIQKQCKKNKKFIIITGGGSICRTYQNASRKMTKTSIEDLDWIGIAATKLNGELVRTLFGSLAYKKVHSNFKVKVPFKKVLVGAGIEPGHSSDYDAVEWAKAYKAKKIFNLTNVDYVYTKDPTKFKDATPLKELSWKEYESKFLKSAWKPGMHIPFDGKASKVAKKQGMKVYIINGKKLKNLEAAFNSKKCIATILG